MSVRAQREIERLDRRLAKRGTPVRLKHVTQAPGASGKEIGFSVKTRAFLTQLSAQDVITPSSGLSQGDFHVTISPTDLLRRKWSGAIVKKAPGDPVIPVATMTKILIDGKWRDLIGSPLGTKIDDVVIRIEFNAKG